MCGQMANAWPRIRNKSTNNEVKFFGGKFEFLGCILEMLYRGTVISRGQLLPCCRTLLTARITIDIHKGKILLTSRSLN